MYTQTYHHKHVQSMQYLNACNAPLSHQITMDNGARKAQTLDYMYNGQSPLWNNYPSISRVTRLNNDYTCNFFTRSGIKGLPPTGGTLQLSE